MKPGLLMLPSAVSDSRVHNILPNRIDTDFQFSRASAATRVNHQGLIENVGYFSSELVQNGDFSELGPEIITNGDNIQESEWTLGVGWSVSNGKIVADTNSNSTCAQLDSFTTGKTYKIVFTVSNYVSGQVRPQLAGSGSVNGQNVLANGTYTQYIVAIANHNKFRFQATGNNFTGSINNVSVKQVDPNSEWSLVDIKFTGTNTFENTATNGRIFQSFTTVIGSQYKVSFTINSGLWNIYASTNNNSSGQIVSTSPTTASGFFEFTATTTTSFLAIYNIGASGSVASITNISVVEVIGDKPRLDYDPINPTCPHLLLEPQSTNLVTFSEDFSQWAKQGGGTGSAPVLTSGYTSPDGTNNAYKVSFNKGTGTTTSDYSILASNAWSTQSNTASFYIKADSPQKIVFRNSSNWQLVDVTTEWQRVSKTDTGNSIQLGLRDGYGISGIPNTSEVYIFGAQAETTAYATSYIPTAGATETRVGETCTNAGNVDTFNSEEGVLYAEIAALVDDGTFRNISVGDGGVNNVIRLNYNTTLNRISFINRVGGSNTAFINYNATDITQYQKVAFKFKLNDFSVFANGLRVGTDTSGAVNAANIFNTLKFDQGDGGSPFYGKVKSLATYNRALTDTELYTITSTQYSAYSGMVAALGNYTIPC